MIREGGKIEEMLRCREIVITDAAAQLSLKASIHLH